MWNGKKTAPCTLSLNRHPKPSLDPKPCALAVLAYLLFAFATCRLGKIGSVASRDVRRAKFQDSRLLAEIFGVVPADR